MGFVVDRKVNVSLSPDLIAYAKAYQQTHGLVNLSAVFVRAPAALRTAELAAGYRAMAADYAARPDPLVEATGHEGLEASDETTW